MAVVAVARDKYARGLPHPTKKAQFAYEQMDLVDALLRTYPSDAHMVSYTVNYHKPPEDYQPGWQQRLKKDTDLDLLMLDASMTCFTVDVDNEGHAKWDDALLAAMAEQVRLPILQTAAHFCTKHGWRIIQPLANPIPVRQAERYLRKYLLELQMAGIKADMACKDWTRHMRMPNVHREGEASQYVSPLISVDHVAPRVPTEPDPVEEVEIRRKTGKRASVAVPKTYNVEAPPVFERTIASIARAISTSVTENWHSMYLAVSGALLKSNHVLAEALPAVVFAIAVRAGSAKPENHRRGAEDTVARQSAGMAVTGVRELKLKWPRVADAVIDATDEQVGRARAEATAPPAVPEQTLAEVTAALTNVIRNAPDGVTVVAGSCGLGKALSLDTPIATPTGWTTMGDIKEGDEVFDETGEICVVTRTTGVMKNRLCFEVVFDDGTKIVADAAHRWVTRTKKVRTRDNFRAMAIRLGAEPKEPIEPKITTTYKIYNSLRVDVSKKTGRSEVNHSIDLSKPLKTRHKNLELDPYVLGVWLGDGNSASPYVTSMDSCIIDEIRKTGVFVGEGKRFPDSKASLYPMRMYAPTGKPGQHIGNMMVVLRRLGVLNNKHIPSDYMRASFYQRLALLQGMMDTDGHCQKSGTCELSFVNRRLSENAHELIMSLGLKASFKTGKAVLNGRYICDRYRIVFTPRRLDVFRMERKRIRQSLATKQPSRTSQRFIVDVRPVKSVPVRCIEVDSPNHLFLCSKSFVPTHNSVSAQVVAEERARKLYLTDKATGARAPVGSKTSISANTSKLAHQFTNDLRARGIPVRRLFGVLSEMNIDDPRARECKFFDVAAPLAKGGQSIPYEFCTGRGIKGQKCGYYDTCKARDGEEGPSDARVTVGPHALLGDLDRAAGPTGLLVIDEPPPALETIVITQEDVSLAIDHMEKWFEYSFTKEMRPVLVALKGWTNQDLEFNDITDAISPVTELKRGSPPLKRSAIFFAKQSKENAHQIGAISRVLKAMYQAMCSKKLVGVRLDDRGIVVTTTNAVLTKALQREGSVVITDANAKSNLPAYAKIVGYQPPFHHFEMGDSVPIERTFLRCGSANRSGWFSHGHLQVNAGLIGAVRAVIEWADRGEARALALISFATVEFALLGAFGVDIDKTWKEMGHPVAGLATIRKQLGPILERFQLSAHASTNVPKETVIVQKKAGPFREILLGHYGALEGLNNFSRCDALATIGDPWQNLGDTDAEAAFLAVDAGSHAEARCQEELEQAHGRLRTIHRTATARAIHVGRVLPGGVGWRGEAVHVDRLESGRPPNARSMGLDELMTIVESLGGVRATARALGCSHPTIARYLNGTGGVPPGTAVQLRELAIGVSLPQGGSAPGRETPVHVLGSPVSLPISPPTPTPTDVASQGGTTTPSHDPTSGSYATVAPSDAAMAASGDKSSSDAS